MLLRALVFLAFLQLASIAVAAVSSSTVLESATLGPPSQSNGPTISSFQYVGARFHVSNPTVVDQVGGFLGSGMPGSTGTIFAAIVGLTSPTGFPAVRPSDFAPLASTTFEVMPIEHDLLTPLKVLLPVGDYALIFGSGRFGATGQGTMPRENVDTLQASYFIGSFPNISTNLWRNESGFHGMRFVVTGTMIPEPATYALGVIGIMALGFRRRSIDRRR